MNEIRFISRRPTRRDGFTLIEVVIALAIFVFGALAIIRIFPPALGVIQNSGDQLVASNMNRSLLTKFETSPETLPYGVYDDTADTGWAGNMPGAVVGTRTRNNSLPPSIDTINGSALTRFRQVVGERHKVRQLITSGGNQPFVLANFPYEGSVFVYRDRTVSGAKMQSNGKLDISEAKFEDGTAFTMAAGDLVYVSYSWLEYGIDLANTTAALQRIQSVTDELCVTTSPRPSAIIPTFEDVLAFDRGKTLVTGEVAVKFRQYLGVVAPSASNINTLTGLVNLSGQNPAFATNVGTVSLDYTVLGWGKLVKDAPLDATPDENQINRPQDAIPADYRGVNLPVRLLDDENLPSFFALILAPNPNQTNRDAVDVTGSLGLAENSIDIVTPFSSLPPLAPPQPPVIPENKKGQIFFRVPDVNSSYKVTPQARVVYSTLDKWSQQLSIAAQSYIPTYAVGSGPTVVDVAEKWRSYYVGRDGGTGTPDGFIYFKPSEAGKTVVVTYSYSNSLPNSTPDTDTTVSRVLTIDSEIIPRPPAVVGGFGEYVSRLQLTTTAGNPVGRFFTSIRDVRGTSIQSRTAWLDGSRFSQISSTSFRKGSEQ